MNEDKNIITPAPIEINELKKYFADKEITYTIDYANSKLQGTKSLTYLSNLDLPCDIEIDRESEEFDQLLSDYFNAGFIVDVPVLESAAIMVLLECKGLTNGKSYEKFVEDNKEIIKHWIGVLDSMLAFHASTVSKSEKMKSWIETLPTNCTETTAGINFVNMFKYPDFFLYYQSVDIKTVQFYTNLFTQNMFKGNSLFKYWATAGNPIFLLTFGIAEKKFTIEEYQQAKVNSIKEIIDASYV